MAERRLEERQPVEIVPRMLHSGRHRLSPEIVEASQRMRLLEAIIEVVADVGYSQATVAVVTEYAGVSRRTFYQFYKDKDECFVEAWRAHAQVLYEVSTEPSRTATSWDQGLWLGLEAFLKTIAENPSWARVYAIGLLSANERILEERYRGDAKWIRSYRGLNQVMREADPLVPEASDATLWSCIGVNTELIRHAVRTKGPESVIELLPEIFGTVLLMLGSPVRPDKVTADTVATLRKLWNDEQSN